MFQGRSHKKQKAFTLVEMIIVVPIALLIVTGFVALMVTMVGDVIASRTYNSMTYDIQDALNTIERDVTLSTQFMTSSGALLSPQGKNNGTGAFTSTAGDLVLGSIATDKNPLDPTRRFIYYSNAPHACADSQQLYKNRIFYTTTIYFVNNNSLWRRTYVPDAVGLCQNAWQVNSCSPDYSSATRCRANDVEVLKNVSSFNVSYFINPQDPDSAAVAPSSANNASTIKVSISGMGTGAGREISATSSARTTKLSTRDITQSPPGTPSISASASGTRALFTWPGVPTATSYIVQYNVNGGSWVTASENSTQTSFSVDSLRGDTVSIRVAARNTTGTSGNASQSTTIPIWTPCSFQNGWADYGSPYEPCGYTITRHGVVMLRGLLRSGGVTDDTVIFTLPPGYRPTHRPAFQASINPNAPVRIDVDAGGNVRILNLPAGANNGYLSLAGITFIPQGSLHRWNNLTPLNGWSNDPWGHPPLQSTTDGIGRIHTQGLLQQGSAPQWSDIANMAAGTAPGKVHIFPARMCCSGNNYNSVGMRPNGTMMNRGINAYWLSYQTMHYAAGHSGWQNFTYVAGTPADRQMGNGWTHYNNDGNIHETPQFTKGADGIVTVKGMIRSGNAGGGVAIAKLPAGYQPEGRLIFNLAASTGFAQVDIDVNGYITVRSGVSSGWTSLDGIHFMAR